MAQRKQPLFQRLFLPYLSLLLIAIAAVSWYGSRTYRSLGLKELDHHLESQARMIRDQIPHDPELLTAENVDLLCKQLGKTSGSRVTIVLRDGTVAGDSDELPEKMDNHASRPEIVAAWNGDVGQSERFSHTVQESMHYVAIPLLYQGEVVAAVRTSIAVKRVSEVLQTFYSRVAFGALLVALVAALLSYFIARRIVIPLEDMKRGAERFARGYLETRLKESEVSELSSLAKAMNEMASELDSRIRTVSRQREEQEAVLASMSEGVLAVDANNCIIIINHAAAVMFQIDSQRAHGRPIEDVLSSSKLQQFVQSLLSSERDASSPPIEIEIEGRAFQANGATMHNPKGDRLGAVAVFSDITRMRSLERTRREFVANVSHELKTPITSIKGYVETLRDGVIADREQAMRFLQVISNRTDQLTSIIDDLLDLARIEREAGEDSLSFEKCAVVNLLHDAADACRDQAEQRGQMIRVFCKKELAVRGNARLLHQALVNLVDNAIKYGFEDTEIRLEAWEENGEVTLQVADDGPGVPAEHVERIFERFYRADTSRSRDSGGTGLGLAIVKHIALAHGGNVSLDTAPEEGCRFLIHLPKT